MTNGKVAPLSCILKLKRATEHYKALQQEIMTFFKHDPKNPVFQFEADDAERIVQVRMRILKPLPQRWGVIVGDCIYNLRCALDHLVSITAEKHAAPTENTEFPIFLHRNKYVKVDGKGQPMRGSGLYKVAGLPPSARALIERVQPYNRTGGPPDLHPLWLLEEISNRDKHRKVDLVHAAIESGFCVINGLGHGKVEQFTLPVGAIDDGTIVASLQPMPGYKLAVQMDVNFQFTPGIAFSPKGPGRGLPVLDTLIEMNNMVNDIINSFDPFVR